MRYAYSVYSARILVATLLLALVTFVTLVGGAHSSATPTQQIPLPPPTKLILLTDSVPDPKQTGVVWFAPTGHTLRGAFLDYWNRYGGLAQFGYPLTEEFFEERADQKQYQVQYFERNRFEYHPENKGTQYEVLLGTLGLDSGQADPPVSLIAIARYFPETGHNLAGKFREYWDAHGGLFVHGYPITEPFQEKSPTDGKLYIVQYFERSRFELHPENAGSPYEVLLGLLGKQAAQMKGYTFGWYPLYGYGADYSWFSGYYKNDGRKCQPCGCSTVRYVSPSNTTYTDAGEVWPYFQDKPLRNKLDVKGLEPTLDPQIFLVVFGQLDDRGSITAGKPETSCVSPKFKVTGFQFNPVR